jgi:hypothetical protein
MTRLVDNYRTIMAAGGVVLILWLSFCERVSAQSGRRASQTVPAQAPSLPAVQRPPEEVAPRVRAFRELSYPVHLLIGRHVSSKHLSSEDIIFNSFIQRLNELPNIQGTLIGNLKRSEAAKRALSETDSYVVLLEFEVDNFQGGKVVINSPDLEVKYFVFAPRDTKPRFKGKVYYQSVGGPQGRKANSPTDTPIRITVEAAGHEAAERLYFLLAELVGTKPEK